ncbi:oxidoreductase [Lithospermum erythrorhizon]|uniref:Oxidoreductase n=1 Tax=Lithospermum erythrorhizon TaxID=34254 RepID=A0AAV3Q2J2_LITER
MDIKKAKIFVIGGTGNFGRYIVTASVSSGHQTVALVRQNTIDTDPEKAALVDQFKASGVQIVYGDINVDHETLVSTIKTVEVIISCIGGSNVADQVNIISAIKDSGLNIKRFFPSEFAIDVDRLQDPVEPAASFFSAKANIRRAIEAEGIPYTFVVANGFAGRFWPNLAQVNPSALIPDIEQVVAYGDGNSKITSTMEEDIASYVMKAVDDERTLNKILYLRPPANILSYNDLFDLWDNKSGQTLKRTYISEEQLLQMIQDPQTTSRVLLSVCYSVAIKNDYASYEIDPSTGVEATMLYPEVKYTTVDEYLNQFVPKAKAPVLGSLLEKIKGLFHF